jgi:hypothetical protein
MALIWAVIFAILLNLAVVVTFTWPELVSPMVRVALWSVLAVVWLTSAAWCAWRVRFESPGPVKIADLDTLFVQAQSEYLGSDWNQAERTVRRLLRASPQDVDARLMLATLLRCTRRIDEARQQLKRLEQLELSEKWRLEIRHEHERLDRLADEGQGDGSTGDDGPEAVNVGLEVAGQPMGAAKAA